MFDLLARLATRRPRRVVGVAVVAALIAGAFGGGVAEELGPYGADDPRDDSVKSDKRLEAALGYDPATALIAVVDTGADSKSGASRTKVKRVEGVLEADPDIAVVTSFYDSGERAQVSKDGRSQFLAVNFKTSDDDVQQDAAKRLGDELNGDGVKLGGLAAASGDVNEQVSEDLARAELIAFPILFLLSVLFFRSLVAAALPLLVGGLSIIGTFAALKLMNGVVDVSVFALNLTTGLGLGLAIDYSLFIVARYREEMERFGPGAEAMRKTLATAGRTVFFSSLTVAAALASLLVFPQRFLYSMGLGGSMVALIAAFVALVVLPSVLMLLGHRINSFAPRWLQRTREREAGTVEDGFWYRLSRFVMRRPAPVAAISAAVLLLAGLPFLGVKFTSVDATVLPQDKISRQVDTQLKQQFPAGRANPITIAADSAPTAEMRDYARELGALPGAAGAIPPQRIDSETSLIRVFPAEAELADSSQQLVRDVRDRETSFTALAGGEAADFVDLKGSLERHLPIALLIVAASTIGVLFLMTGSVVLPIKALLMNVLSLSATFGLLVLIFQDGRLEGPLGYTSQGALEATMPVLLFAVAFGLSTDYGVFLLSRIKEARDAGASDSDSVAIGLERTGRIVTAAALLFSIAIGAFATSEIIFIKENGVGTALAVLIDATIIRALLVPSLMALLGSRNWWAPRPLRKIHARFGLSEAPAR